MIIESTNYINRSNAEPDRTLRKTGKSDTPRMHLGTKVVVILAAVAAMMPLIASCSSGSAGLDGKAEGWISDDIFQVRSSGNPGMETAGRETRKNVSRNIAVLSARRLVLDKFAGIQFESTFSILEFTRTRRAMENDFGEIIRRGKVVKENFTADDACEIIYQVEEKGLRRKVMRYGPRP